jgi:hypothetical protein
VWVGKAIAAGLLWLVLKMILARYGRSQDKCNEVVVCSGSNQKTTMESIVAAQFGLKNVHEMIQLANISILKIQSLVHAKARKVFLAPIHDSTFLKQSLLENFLSKRNMSSLPSYKLHRTL